MATKVIILGEQSEQKKELRKIEFVKVLVSGGEFVKAEGTARKFENIELICRDYAGEGSYDLMFAYDIHRSNGLLYLGHFNDGVV